MQLSIVMPCYNNAETLGEQFDALIRQTWDGDWEVIFSDNGSTDGSRAVAESYLGRVRGLKIVDASAQRGAPYALNTGVAASSGTWLAFCDGDDVVCDQWVAAIARAMQNHRFVGGRFDFDLLNPPDRYQFRAQQDKLERLTFGPRCLHAGSGNMAIHRDCFESVGGFDNTVKVLYDTDMCIRLHKLGIEPQFDHDMLLHVRRRKTLRQQYRQSKGYIRYRTVLVKRYDNGMSIGGQCKRLFKQFMLAAPVLPAAMFNRERRPYCADRLGRIAGEFVGLIHRNGVSG